MKTRFFWIAALAAGVSGLAAQNASVPRIPKPAAMAKWTIDYKYPKAANEKEEAPDLGIPPQVRRREYVVTGETASIHETYVNGGTAEIFQIGNLELRKPVGSSAIIAFDLAVQPLPGQLFRKAFPGLDWLNSRYFQGAVEAYGQTCFYFREEKKGNGHGGADELTDPFSTREGWISVETGLPVAFKNDEMEGRYTFGPAPAGPVELPGEFQRFVREKFRSGPPPGQTSSLLKRPASP